MAWVIGILVFFILLAIFFHKNYVPEDVQEKVLSREEEARRALEEGNLDRAEELFRNLVLASDWAGRIEARNALCEIYEKQGLKSKSVDLYRENVREDCACPTPYLYLVNHYLASGQAREARKIVNRFFQNATADPASVEEMKRFKKELAEKW